MTEKSKPAASVALTSGGKLATTGQCYFTHSGKARKKRIDEHFPDRNHGFNARQVNESGSGKKVP
ncbi:hypothetical protein [Propionivibrio sp.]|uniref:hypothetical protein n=1 Tax=Propionivibrio sp. TaxID=2212460 RepID=UPI0025CCB54B|nr:hypothetical protein [Propionivibrio sp.]MBK8399710.1 hypothetical protein [Propionivibrio sp.]MBK8743393.1 hypothetical protein [Propionivibrio sp.]MBK8894582.1 hypothetical protein [Propionivibrio sp.]MBL0207066.1 hypothetical protein [Propionivibrio sp.]